MSNSAAFLKKVVNDPALAQVSFGVEVLEPYLAQAGTRVSRTNTVGRVKTATWSIDFGIAPDEKTIHVPVQSLQSKLPERERAHWFAHSHAALFSENFLKMQMAHACVDDGGYRAWGEEEPLF